jgi:3-oxoacyl-[acyl-carrier protein] reductase
MTFPDLKGKVAVVTGGSRGVGAAACRLLAANDVAFAAPYLASDAASCVNATTLDIAGRTLRL